MSTLPSGRPDATAAITNSFGEAWKRTKWLFFGPGASLQRWFVWGLIILLAGQMGSGFNSGGNWRDGGAKSWDRIVPSIGPGMVTLIAVGAALLILVVLVFVYISCRFRFVLLEGVIAGEPKIRGVFRRTSAPGLSYFLTVLIAGWVSLIAIVLALLPGWPVLSAALHDRQPSGGAIALLVLSVLFLVLPMVIASALFSWWLYHFVLPYAWVREMPFKAALGQAWRTTRAHFGAMLLFLLLYIIAKIAAGMIVLVLFCVTCCAWIGPIALLAGLGAITAAAPIMAIVTVPLLILLGFGFAWLMASAFAPIPVFFRAWTLSFLSDIDPQLVPAAPSPAPDVPPAPDAPSAPPAADATPADENAFRAPEHPGYETLPPVPPAPPPPEPGPASGDPDPETPR